MKVNLVRIGNSKGVRIPTAIIRECGFGDQIDLRVEQGIVVLAPVRGGREGWGEAFEKMAASGDDEPLLPDDIGTDFDTDEWTW